jgi:hypothetical protein
LSAKKDLADAKVSTLAADEVYAIFDAAKKKALKSFGGVAPEKRDGLPRGVYQLPSGKFQSSIGLDGKYRYVGTFDTPEQASAAYLSVRKDLDDAKMKPYVIKQITCSMKRRRKP